MKVLLNLPMGDPLMERTIDVDIPAGFGIIYSGLVQEGDLHLNYALARTTRDGKPVIEWRMVEPKSPEDHLVECYSVLIRPGTKNETPCERCQLCPRWPRERYCPYCRHVIINQGRKRNSQRV